MKLVRCAVLTLNEEKNLKACLESIRRVTDLEVTIFDGGSSDRTLEIAKELGVAVVSMPGTSLSFRRQTALETLDCDFVLFVDADQRLTNDFINHESIIEKYFDNSLLAGIAFKKNGDEDHYWSQGFQVRNDLFISSQGSPKVIGTPCIFRRELARKVGFEKTANGSIDDTYLCKKLGALGYVFAIADEHVIEIFRSSFRGMLRKAYWYGLGDGEYIKNVGGREMRNHLYHICVRNLIIQPAITLFRRPTYWAFMQLFGISRFWGLVVGLSLKSNSPSYKS